jgi:transcriptional regulator with XRE-family HTH domain
MSKRPNNVKESDFKLGRRIHKMRKFKGITQEQLAEKTKTSLSWISHLEVGQEVPNIAMLRKIARALGVEVKDLIPF